MADDTETHLTPEAQATRDAVAVGHVALLYRDGSDVLHGLQMALDVGGLPSIAERMGEALQHYLQEKLADEGEVSE